ncbi:MAG: hypothetical protein IKH57_23710 [Clostridia bacterium]|nr:hypothetical protein [Clostridia bacterium]
MRNAIGSNFFNFRLVISFGCQIELIAFVGELSDPGHVHRNKGTDFTLHFQAFQIVFVVFKGQLQLMTFCVFLIHGVSGKVILGKMRNLKESGMIQGLNIPFHAFDVRRRYSWELPFNKALHYNQWVENERKRLK